MEAIINYIHNNYNENISLEKLSSLFFISQYHLCREFKKNMNISLSKYINITKLSYAKRQLIETDNTIIDISHKSGFTNVTHFNRVFKSLENKTPKEFRNIYR